MTVQQDTITCADIFDLCTQMDDQSVDMILADFPYGTTKQKWDIVIPFEPMWEAFNRIIKSNGAMVFTANQPFTSLLTYSNLKMFRYEWVWNKCMKVGQLEAPRRPLVTHETVLVFSQKGANYYPAMNPRRPRQIHRGPDKSLIYKGKRKEGLQVDGAGYPSTILTFPAPRVLWGKGGRLHPNQKPVALFEYLIRTYTQPGELVFDPCCGSGTTAVAALNTERHSVCGDSDLEFVQIARERLRNTDPYQSTQIAPNVIQQSLFSKEGSNE